MFKYVYFFLHGIITKTSIEFIKRNSFIREKLIIVVNIKEVRPHNECRLIEQKLKRAIREQLGPLAVDLLYMGDINEEFNLRSEELRSGLSDWELIKEWEKRQIDFNELKEKYRNSIIGDYLIDDIIDTGSGQFSDIEGYHNGIDKILFDIDESVNIEKDKLLSLAEDGHPNAQFLLAEMIKEGRNDFKQDEEEENIGIGKLLKTLL